ncbi:pyridoxal phosphate-dependent transferase [Aspergillus similis]
MAGKISSYHVSASQEAIALETQYSAHNYHPLPVVFAKAQGTSVWDPEGNHYLDFLSAYSAVNQGHCHPELVKVLAAQAGRLTLSSRAFYNDVFPRFAQMITEYFGFDMVLPMNTGAEAVETAVKMARKWGYKTEKIEPEQAQILTVTNNFHGRTFVPISLSSDSESRDNYGPYLPKIDHCIPGTSRPITYNDKDALRQSFQQAGPNLAAFLIEPIQGEGGIIVPDDSYLQELRAHCDEHNVLLICDEIQTGIGRTGKLLCSEWSGIKPDLVLLGKAISGGMYPVSCVLGRRDVMLTIEPRTHGSTYGGNPLGCAVAMCALEIVRDQGLVENSRRLGEILRGGLQRIQSPIIQEVRGRGLLNAIVVDEGATYGRTALDLCLLLKDKGLLNVIRLAPPLIVTEEEIRKALFIIEEAVAEFVR